MRLSLLVASLLMLSSLVGLADPDVPTLMGQAQRAYIAGDYDTSRELFGEVLQINPQNVHAIQFLRLIRLKQAGQAPTPAADPIQALILPKIEFKDASFSSALDFFKQKAADQGVTVSFVPQLPAPQMDHTVTLSLTNIPFLDALNYLCQLNHASYKIEPYAIVIRPVSADAGAAPSAAQ